MTVIDARFAGGPIDVRSAELGYDSDIRVVNVEFPGCDVALFPHEADKLADALRDRGELTEEGSNRDEARDAIVLMRDAETLRPDHIRIMHGDDLELDRNAALAFASRLIDLAAQLPEPRRILRRRADVDAGLQALDW